MADVLTIGELSERSGVAPSALRYYEELGLLSAARVSGQRRYEQGGLERVGLILLLRDTGFSLAEMKAFMVAQVSSEGWRELARRKVAELDERIAQAEAARSGLQHALRCRHKDILQCPNFAAVLAGRLARQSLAAAHPH